MLIDEGKKFLKPKIIEDKSRIKSCKLRKYLTGNFSHSHSSNICITYAWFQMPQRFREQFELLLTSLRIVERRVLSQLQMHKLD